MPPKGCTNLRLRQLMRGLDQIYDAELARSGLRTTQYSLLSHVVRLGPLRPGELARVMKMQASTLTRNLQPLVVAGWVEVGAGDDARSRSVSATACGREKRAQAQRHWKAAQVRVNQLLGEAQVATLHTVLDRALERLGENAEALEEAGDAG